MRAPQALAQRLWARGSIRGWTNYLSAGVLGAAAALALPPFYVLPLLLVVFPFWLWQIIRAAGPWQAFWLGWWFGFGHFVAGLYWIANALLVEGMGFAWAVPFAAGALPALLAVYIGLAALVTFVAARRGVPPVFALALAWTALEWLRGHLFTGFPWNLLGTVWAVSDVLVQPVAVIGTYGLGFLTVLFAAGPYSLIRHGPKRLRAWLFPALGTGIVAGMAVFGFLRLDGAATQYVPDIRLRIVQANIPQADKWRPDLRDDHLVLYMRLSAQESAGITHFIWPETAVPYFLGEEPSRRVLIGRLLPREGAVITGAPRIKRHDDAPPELWNSMFVIDHAGRILAHYDKTHLVPFGEYLPARSLLAPLGLDKVVYGLTDYTAGGTRRPIPIDGLPPFTPLICYEIAFPGAVTGKDGRPEWLLNITNDAWYGETSGPYQHLVAAKMRAVEEGLPVVRAAGTGISAIFDPYGRRLVALGLNLRGVLDSRLPIPLSDAGLYARYGDGILIVLMAAGMALAGLGRLRWPSPQGTGRKESSHRNL